MYTCFNQVTELTKLFLTNPVAGIESIQLSFVIDCTRILNLYEVFFFFTFLKFFYCNILYINKSIISTFTERLKTITCIIITVEKTWKKLQNYHFYGLTSMHRFFMQNFVRDLSPIRLKNADWLGLNESDWNVRSNNLWHIL